MSEWTVVKANRQVVASGSGGEPPSELQPGQRLLLGPRGSFRRHRATADFTGLELRPPIYVVSSASSLATDEALVLTLGEPATLFVDGDPVGDVLPGDTSITFDEAGQYQFLLRPTDPETTTLEAGLPITVTAGGAPPASDLRVEEKQPTLLQAVRAKLDDFDLAITRAEAREAAAEEIRTRTITTNGEAVQALRDLAAIEKQNANDLAAIVRHVRRGFFAVASLLARKR